nr:chromo domain-containing protein [Tanacetum cinerariifolium]
MERGDMIAQAKFVDCQIANGREDEFKEGQPMEQPVGVCDSRMVLQNRKYERQVLVQWAGRSPEEARWEWLIDFQSAYPTCNLDDKVVFKDGGNVTPLVGRLGHGKCNTPK